MDAIFHILKGKQDMQNKIKVIVDCDPGIDDSLALLEILQNPRFEVLAITIQEGNVGIKKGILNAFRVLELLNKHDIPVFEGANKTRYFKTTYAEDTHGIDGLGETFIPLIENYNPSGNLKEFLQSLFEKFDDINLICLGPLTNLSYYQEWISDFDRKVSNIYIMGGNYRSHGNCSQLAEFNFFFDPTSAKMVFKKTTKLIHVIPLDVTRKIVLTDKIIDLITYLNPQIGEFVKKITRFYMWFHKEYENIEGCVINDPLVPSLILNHQILKGFEANLTVIDPLENDLQEPYLRGVSLVERFNKNVTNNAIIYTKVDVDKFFVEFISSICAVTKSEVRKAIKNMKVEFKFKYPYEL